MRTLRLVLATTVISAFGCKPGSGDGGMFGGVTPSTHTAFPIVEGAHAVDCATCHSDFASFTQFSCTGCHAHDAELSDALHKGPAAQGYAFDSAACYSCHPAADHFPLSHTSLPPPSCATCHDVDAPYAALPKAGFTHPPTGVSDCAQCHETTAWPTTGVAPGISADPLRAVQVDALIPAYAGTTIVSVAPSTELLVMGMDHASAQIDPLAFSACANCHESAAEGSYYPGALHSSLDQLLLPQPDSCSDCHSVAAPVGFVGPLASGPARTPNSGEMKHDAVQWAGDVPTTTAIVSNECGSCHTPPTVDLQATWATRADGGTPVRYHANLALTEGPDTCVDCHANSRPAGVLTSTNATMPVAGLTFDHDLDDALADCQTCHATGLPTQWTSWSGGRFHAPGSATPATCLSCHDGERPTSTSGWQTPNYTSSPFDYGTNINGETHGAGQDCVSCHAGPGTGAWGGTQNWRNGHFVHGAGTLSETTCITCHASQRPSTTVGPGNFDHTKDGGGDCFACHQETVRRGNYVSAVIPGGDWSGGAEYPGDNLASSLTQKVTVSTLVLNRSPTTQLITSMNTVNQTLYNGMLHTSSQVPAAISPGPAAAPIETTCWHCHTHDAAGNVTALNDGIFHDALDGFRVNVGDPVTPLAQPARCLDCHKQMYPSNIVEKASSSLIPMDHTAQFKAAVTIGGTSVTAVNQIDCSVCHSGIGVDWTDGTFHTKIGSAAPKDCAVCHYPLMADTAKADVASGTTFKMVHRDASITKQNCDACHTGALAQSTQTPVVTRWQTGTLHATVGAQPANCNSCHTISKPTTTKQGTVSYSMAQGGTATNAGQWMSHAVAAVSGADCKTCHAADAKASGAAWSKSAPLHAALPTIASCGACHGLQNGNGTTPGTNNNLPAGVTDSKTVTTAPATAVAAGTHDRIDHGDLNVTSHECNVCHTQAGPSSAQSIAGKEWAQAKFHTSLGTAYPLLANDTTARCSHCHINVKPGASYPDFDHSALTNTSGSQDCKSCHSFPGTGTTSAPNWKGAVGGAPPTIIVGNFTIPQPPASNGTTSAPGITGLPHPTVSGTTTCASCHTGGLGGKYAIGYDHASTLIASNCRSCHEAGSDLLTPPWNGATTASAGAGDTRPITLGTIVAHKGKPGGDQCSVTSTNHFYPVDCKECHKAPTGIAKTTTGSAYISSNGSTVWAFPHRENAMASSTCNMCHNNTCRK